MTLLTLALKYWRALGVAALVTAFGVTMHIRDRQHDAALRTAVTAGKAATRDSVLHAAATLYDSTTRASTVESGALREARAVQDRAALHLQRTIDGKAATDALYAARTRLSDSARADSTVAALEAASVSVAAENDTLRTQSATLIATTTNERTRANALHDADTAAVRGLAHQLVAARDSLAVEVARPKRTKKRQAVIAVASAGTVFLYHLIRKP